MDESNLNTSAVTAETTEPTAAEQMPKKPNGFLEKVDAFFGVSANGSSFKTEIIGGITTFFAMCYILIVNPSQIGGGSLPIWNSVYIATALGALVGTLFYAFWAKMPFAQAPGMGLNSFFFVSFMLYGFGKAGAFTTQAYQAGLSVILLSGILFMILSATGLRKKIATAMPSCLKKAIPAGIGLFIAFIGFKNAGLVQFNPYTFVQMSNLAVGKFNAVLDTDSGSILYSEVTWYVIAPALVTFFGILMIAFLNKTRLKKGSVILGILFASVLYYLFNINNADVYGTLSVANPVDTFTAFGTVGFGGAFLGFKYWTPEIALSGIMLVITFCLVDMFDTFGTLQGTATEAGMLDKNGDPKNLSKCLMSDATATLLGSVFGTSTVTTYVESAAGVSAGARTGLSSLVVALLFFVGLFLSPIASLIPSSAVAPALIYVGVLMLKNIKDVDFSDMTAAVPAFLTVIMMPLSYSISNGIAIGMISYSILKLANVFISGKQGIVEYFKVGRGNWGDFFSKDIFVLIIAILFTLRFFLVAM